MSSSKKSKAIAAESDSKTTRKTTPAANPLPAKVPASKTAPAKTVPAKAGRKGKAGKSAEKPSADPDPGPIGAKAKKAAAAASAPTPARKAKTGSVAKAETTADPAKLEAIKNLMHKPKHTPAIFKLPTKKVTPVLFTLEDVRELLKNRGEVKPRVVPEPEPVKAQPAVPEVRSVEAPPLSREIPAPRQRVVGAANLADILGFVPVQKKPTEGLVREVPKKWSAYYKLLMELRQHLREKLNIHSEDTLLKTGRDDAGDASAYSQHIADAGTDSFDRDFALGLLSNEKEALSEVEEAIERIFNGTYGICEITGQTIAKERLEAVPFTRFSLEGQAEYEKNNRRLLQRNSYFAELTGDEAGAYSEDSAD